MRHRGGPLTRRPIPNAAHHRARPLTPGGMQHCAPRLTRNAAHHRARPLTRQPAGTAARRPAESAAAQTRAVLPGLALRGGCHRPDGRSGSGPSRHPNGPGWLLYHVGRHLDGPGWHPDGPGRHPDGPARRPRCPGWLLYHVGRHPDGPGQRWDGLPIRGTARSLTRLARPAVRPAAAACGRARHAVHQARSALQRT